MCPNRDLRGKNAGGAGRTRSSSAGKGNQTRAHFVEETETEGSEEEDNIFQMSRSCYKPMSIPISVDGRELVMEIDTGASSSCISRRTYEEMFSELDLKPSSVVFKFYDGSRVQPLEVITPVVEYGGKRKSLDLFLVDKGVTSLVGRQWVAELNVPVQDLDVFSLIKFLRFTPFDDLTVSILLALFYKVIIK